MIRWWFTLAYCTLLLLGCYAIVVRQVPLFPLSYRAVRHFNAGHLLQPGDLLPAPSSGRYLRQAVDPGDLVRLDTDTVLPELHPSAGALTVAVKAPTQIVQSGAANAGVSIFLCGAQKNGSAEPYVVQSVLCANGAPDCIILLDVPVGRAASLAGILAAGASTVSGAKCPAQ